MALIDLEIAELFQKKAIVRVCITFSGPVPEFNISDKKNNNNKTFDVYNTKITFIWDNALIYHNQLEKNWYSGVTVSVFGIA